ncbi:MAG TPA: ABC transporter permease [Propionibacteriaceae bacterium]|nr:ABC transporter permease [Propionibacteriaceae bacterium]
MRLFATAGRVLGQLRHDPRTVAMMALLPMLLVGLFSWIMPVRMFDQVGPMLIALFPFTVMFIVTSIATLRERTSGTLERLLTTPLRKAELLFGYEIAFGLVAVLQAILVVSFAVYVCGLEIDGSLWVVGGTAVLNALMGTALGLLASAFARTEFQAVQFMPVFVFPQMALGGVFMPRSGMPDVLSAISDWLPLSYSIEAIQRAVANVSGWDLQRPLLILVGVTLLALLLGSLTLPRRTP